jgi:hypothetical protein
MIFERHSKNILQKAMKKQCSKGGMCGSLWHGWTHLPNLDGTPKLGNVNLSR